MKTFIFGILGLFFASAALAGSGIGLVAYEVLNGKYDQFERSKILEILSKESNVYYADGQNQLGSLFGAEHRQYVTVREMPRDLLNAVVAAEDDKFYTHMGIDWSSTLRAVYKNIFLRKREGASTITQQTVKNLYGRTVTNYRTKFIEAINAIKMERRYTKDEILEFYLNQFHVTGNGRGAGIASKYYFNKEVQELTLNESAFIAGSVKGPKRYNPFIQKNPDAQNRARQEAKIRKNYVLKRMRDVGFITAAQYDANINLEVPFRQGRFQFNELFLTELVQRQLNRPEILKALGTEDPSAIGNLGLRITTTLEYPIQTAAQYGVRQNLSRLEMILSGFQKENSQNFTAIQTPEKYQFYVGKILKIDTTPGQENLDVSLGIPTCSIPTDALVRVAKILDQPFGKGFEKAKHDLLQSLKSEDYILVSVREIGTKLTCDLERRPRIQGALVVLNKGRVAAMVGGYSPYEYNRAAFAKRQPGSAFKSMTYYAAMQLGWQPLDSLLNIRNIYVWQDQYYYPRPDHAPTTSETTLAGAGATSENLATIYLFAHLLDRLTFDQFKDLLINLKIIDGNESEEVALQRIQNVYNARPYASHYKSGLFSAIRNDMLNDVSLANNENLKILLRSMNYGTDFDKEEARVIANKSLPPKEKEQRINILNNNFLRWQELAYDARRTLEKLRSDLQTHPESSSIRGLLSRFKLSLNGRQLFFYGNKSSYEISPTIMGKTLYPFLKNPVPQGLSTVELVKTIQGNPQLLSESSIVLDGVMPIDVLHEIETQIESRFQKIANLSPLERLFWHDDFKYSVGMIYAQQLSKEMGVDSEILPVPSYPLGANVVTLSELALCYQTMINGQTYRYFNNAQENQILLIKRIEDATGQLLWEEGNVSHSLVDSFYSIPMMNILRGTVVHGTAPLAHQNIILRDNNPDIDKELLTAHIRVPSFGKTGTTNDYVNATYVGMLPVPSDAGTLTLSGEDSYVIASYVGYDTNQKMQRRGIKVTGGFGALPAWIETALAIIKENKYAQKLDWQKLAAQKIKEVPFEYGSGLKQVRAPLDTGIVMSDPDANQDETTTQLDANEFINEYANNNRANAALTLQGNFVDSIFVPSRKVAFFNRRIKNTSNKQNSPTPNPIPLQRMPLLDNAEDFKDED